MSKFHKKNKLNRKRRNITQRGSAKDITNNLGEIVLSSSVFEDDLEILETPFGKIKIHDGTLAHAFKNKGVLLELLAMEDKIKEQDSIGRLVHFEKLKDKYPKEPFIAYEIAESYRDLEKKEKFRQLTIENYENYKGYPFIDISYVMLKHDEDKEDVIEEVFGKALNIHEIYPTFKAFDRAMIADFYFVKGMISKENNQLEIAKNCLEVLMQVDDRKGLFLKTSIDYIEKPWIKWQLRIFMVLIVGVILGIIGGIIWGAISVFQMIF